MRDKLIAIAWVYIIIWQIIEIIICVLYVILLNPFTPFKMSQLITPISASGDQKLHTSSFFSHGAPQSQAYNQLFVKYFENVQLKQKNNPDK